MTLPETILAGDVGATHTRLALFTADPRVPAAFETYPSHDHAGLDEMVQAFRAAHPGDVDRAAFGVAGPVRDGRTETINLAWPVDAASLARTLGLKSVGLVNDLAANAYGIAELTPGDFETLNQGSADPGGTMAVISAGTGLGEAALLPEGDGVRVISSEGGHTDFGPRSELEVELYQYLAAEDKHVSYERVCSGLGLLNVYRFLRRRSRTPEPDWLTAEIAGRDAGAVISKAALAGQDPVCVQALDLMVSIYGAEAGNLALKYFATGGVYVGGGIAPRILPRLRDGAFIRSFTAKGRYAGLLGQIPVHVILNDNTALLGAARYARVAEGANDGSLAMTTTTDIGLDTVAELAAQLRVDSIRSTTSAGSGHPTSSMSAADLLAVLTARHFRYDWDQPHKPVNDHLIFSKGHASPLLYSVFKAVGVVSEDELLNDYRRLGQRLEGHPTPRLPWVDVATGSLGQGLPDGVGIALAGKYLERLPYRVWVLCGDSELAEGSIWEALDKAAYYGLSRLVVLADINRLGQRGETDLGWDVADYQRRMEAFGARVLPVDGHDLRAVDEAMTAADDPAGRQPTVILAKTVKGRGFAEVENKNGWHGKPFPPGMADRAITELGGVRSLVLRGPLPEPAEPGPVPEKPNTAPPPAGTARPSATLPTYEVGVKVATRRAYGDALVALGTRDDRIVALDGEVSNSTFADEFGFAYPGRYFEMFIAEQQLVGAATGLAARGYRPFASTFAAFLTRAHDFIRMGAISGVNLSLCGSHAGVEIGADGPSQMALEDLAMMRAVHGSTVLYPSDGTSTAALVEAMTRTPGISYLRTTRGSYPGLYPAGEKFPVGGSKLVRSGPDDQVTLVGAGVTLHEALGAAEILSAEGIAARVIDCYSVKPLDAQTLTAAIAVTGGRIVVAEDHHPEGGLGSAIADALLAAGPPQPGLHLTRLAVHEMPGSGSGAELLAWAGIDAGHIAAAARKLVGG